MWYKPSGYRGAASVCEIQILHKGYIPMIRRVALEKRFITEPGCYKRIVRKVFTADGFWSSIDKGNCFLQVFNDGEENSTL